MAKQNKSKNNIPHFNKNINYQKLKSFKKKQEQKQPRQKTMRKNNIYWDYNPLTKKSDGTLHPIYVQMQLGNKVLGNIITHSDIFFNSKTKKFKINPIPNNNDKRNSKYSIPIIEDEKYLGKTPPNAKKVSKQDRQSIRKANRNYINKNKKW